MYYFASDMHLGSGTPEECRKRELQVVGWLDKVAADAEGIFLVGDVFDFWYEYKRVVPKGFTRLLGKLAELTDRGVQIYFIPGNHDMWQRDYLEKECGIKVCFKVKQITLNGKKVAIEHGDEIYARALGGGTRLMDTIFRSRICRWLFSHLIHPDFALRFGQGWSHGSRKSKDIAFPFLGAEDPMVKEAERRIASGEEIDYFVFGHNHCAAEQPLSGRQKAFFLGNWFGEPVYGVLDKEGVFTLKRV
ncbi:MAG: UDP-2,3-diacylglucosamine diphosphatase [Tidjanibacter sp.]|nr:UDP-2,3-diacylglucosamine diphosphatase [Tidjanibacter sp.]